MSRPADPHTALQRTLDLVTKLVDEWPEFDRRCRDWRKGGYPGRIGEGPTGRGGVSDPTAHEAIFGDDVRRLQSEQEAEINELLGNAVSLVARHKEIMGASPVKVTPAQRGIPKCANVHGCPDDNWADAHRAGRCQTCAHYRWRTGRDRTGREPADQPHS